MNLNTRSLTPPPGTIFLDGVEVTNLLRTPDHEAYYVSRVKAPTIIVPKNNLDWMLEVR